jgi:hypothetical protein
MEDTPFSFRIFTFQTSYLFMLPYSGAAAIFCSRAASSRYFAHFRCYL